MAAEHTGTTRGETTTGIRDFERFRDPVLAGFFPGLLVCDDEGTLVATDAAAQELLPERASTSVLAELTRPALESLAADTGSPSIAVGVDDPPIEGIATLADADGRTLVLIHVRDPLSSPAIAQSIETNRIYEAVLRTGPVFVHVYDRRMNSRWSTSNLRPELGHQPMRPLTAEENYDLVHPADLTGERLGDRLERGELPAGPGDRRRIRVKNADGEWRWLQVLAVNLLDDPDVGSVVVHAWDVSDEVAREQEVENARERLAALIETLDEAVVVVSDERVAFANGRVAELFRGVAAPNELIGAEPRELIETFAATMADPAGFVASVEAMVRRGESVRGRLVETADGRTFEQHFLPIRADEGGGGRVWVHRDITEQLQLRRRQDHLLELEREARRSAEQQAEALRQLDDLKTEFVASVSHELRTPLSAISSFAELLLDPHGPPLSEEQRAIGESIARGSARLGRLVDDLLELARVQSEAVEVSLGPVDLPATLDEAIAEVTSALTPDVEIRADHGAGPEITSDRDRVLQILTNLLSNAVKYATHQVLCHTRFEPGGWTTEIVDDGRGIPREQLERVFDPFYRVEGEAAPEHEAPAGVGLGLAISERLARRLGGSLSIENGPESGVVAQLWLPTDPPEAEG